MPLVGAWYRVWIYFGFVFAWTKGARPRFDTSTDMGLVLIPADAEVDSVIFRLRATDQDADFPLVFEITATITPVVRIDNLPCTLYNKVCQANVILTKRLVPGRLHDFAVRVRDTKGDSNSMQATISVTNATTPRDKIFPHIPSLIMVPEDSKPGKELDYLLVRANAWSGKPVYIELWQPKELFTIRQRQTPTQTRGIITLIGELDFETQSMYTLTMYATDPYTEPGKDTRNIAGLNVVVVVQDVQDVPPIFTLAPPLTRINNSVQPGDIILRVHAEDGDKGVPREIVYGLVSEGNPFTPFFNISETSGEITLARPLEELTQITHVGAPVVLTVVAEEIRRSTEEPPAQATVVDVGFLLGEPGNSPPYFESDNYITTIDENPEPGAVINFGEQYSTRVKDEDIGKAGVFALKLENNNGTFEINPTVAERTADFIITVRDNTLIDYELYKSLTFKIIAQEVGPATNLSTSAPVTIFLRDVNDNPPVFEEESYEVTLSENVTAGSRVVQVHATDKDTGVYGSIRYTNITGEGKEAFSMDSDTGLITIAMGSSLDREHAERLILSVEARDENGSGNRGVVPLIVNLLDVNDNAPIFEKDVYEFMLNADLTNFTSPAFIKANDADAEPPNNIVRYEIIHGNYENKFYLNETSGELILRSPITKIRRKKQSAYDKFAGKEFVIKKAGQGFVKNEGNSITNELPTYNRNKTDETELIHVTDELIKEIIRKRRKRANDDVLYTLTARAYDLGVPHLSSVTEIRIISGIAMEARIMMFVVPGEQPDSAKTAETLATITGGRVTVLETRPYVQQNHTGNASLPDGEKKSIIVARVEQTEPGTPLVDVEKIRKTLAANGVGIIGGTDIVTNTTMNLNTTKAPDIGMPRTNGGQVTNINNTISNMQSEEVIVYKAENKILFWLLIILGLLMLLAIAALIICCICPGCPFYMAPRKRRVHSSETLIMRADGRPKRHLHRPPAAAIDVTWNGRKQAWSADPTRRNWQFNKRNVKNCSLPGDVAYISGQQIDIQMNLDVPRLRDDPRYDHSRRSRMAEQERMYIEDVKGQKIRGYDAAELDSLQRHEMERGSDVQRQSYRQRSDSRYIEPDVTENATIREQHFYREGNAEVLRLVTRGQVEDTAISHHHNHRHHRPTTLIVDGKDIILQRFIEDQKSRHELSMQDTEVARSMESHHRSKEMEQQQPEIILIPDRLELGHRQHVEELGANVQRLVIDHGDYGSQKMERESQIREPMKQGRDEFIPADVPMAEMLAPVTKEHVQSTNPEYSFHDLELARQNALLTRLLLEREIRHPGGGIVDSTSYLETQSLPGQVAIATQTDRTAATQTERHVRSRSDNDDSDEESRQRKKLKSKKKYSDGDWKRSRTLWMKSPIEEEGSPCFDKRLSILRRKVREVKEGRKISLEPEVLKEISDSLDGNGSSYKGEESETVQTYQKSKQQTSIRYKVLNDQEDKSQSSEEICKDKRKTTFGEKSSENMSDDHRMNGTESTSSTEMKSQPEKHGRKRTDEKSPRKEIKLKGQKKSDGVIKPSFRILEKEITMFTKKLSKLGEKKVQESTGSDSTSQEKPESVLKDFKKDSDQKMSKNIDISSKGQKQVAEATPSTSQKQQKGAQKRETTIAKSRQKLKYQQSQVMSTGSSEYDDASDKPKKQSFGIRQESVKQKQPIGSQGHAKLKRLLQTDRRDLKKQTTETRDEGNEGRKDGPPKQAPKSESKFGKMMQRAPKLTTISRKDHVSEECSTSPVSDRVEKRRDAFFLSDSMKKGSTDSSGKDSNGVPRRGRQRIVDKGIGKFSDDFVVESKVDTAVTTNVHEGQTVQNMGTAEGFSEEEVTANGEVKLGKKKVDDTKISVEKFSKIARKTASGKMSEVSANLRDVAQQLIKSCAHDTTEKTEEKFGTIRREKDEQSVKKITSEIKPVTTEEQEHDEDKFYAESAVAPSEKNGVITNKRKDKIISEPQKMIEQVTEDKLHEQERKLLDTDSHENLKQITEKLSNDVDKVDVLVREVKKKIHEEANTFPGQKDMSVEELNKEAKHEMIETVSEQKPMSLEELQEGVQHEVTQVSLEHKQMSLEEHEKEIKRQMRETLSEQDESVNELKKEVQEEFSQASPEHEKSKNEVKQKLTKTLPKEVESLEEMKNKVEEVAQTVLEQKKMSLEEQEMEQTILEQKKMLLEEQEMEQTILEQRKMSLEELKKELNYEMPQISEEQKDMTLEKCKKEVKHEMPQISKEQKDMTLEKCKKEVDHDVSHTYAKQEGMSPGELKKEMENKIAEKSPEQDSKILLNNTETVATMKTPFEDGSDKRKTEENEIQVDKIVEVSHNVDAPQETKELFDKNAKLKPPGEEKDGMKLNTSNKSKEYVKENTLFETEKYQDELVKPLKFMHVHQDSWKSKEAAAENIVITHEEENIHSNTLEDTRRKTAATRKPIDTEIKENVFLEKGNAPNGVEETLAKFNVDDRRITEPVSLDEDKEFDKQRKGGATEMISKDAHISGKGPVLLTERQISDCEEKTSANSKIDDKQDSGKENVFLGEETTSNEGKEDNIKKTSKDPEIREKDHFFLDKQQSVMDFTTDVTQSTDKGTILSDKGEKVLDAANDDLLTDKKDNTSPHKEQKKDEEEQTAEETNAIDRDISERDNILSGKDAATCVSTKPEIVQDNIATDKEKEKDNKEEKISTEVQIIDDQSISEQETVTPETLKIESQSSSEQNDDILKVKDYDSSKISGNDDIVSHMENDTEVPTVIEQPVSAAVSTKMPTVDHNIAIEMQPKKIDIDNQTDKQEGIFLEMFTAVHSLVDKLTHDNDSVHGVSTETNSIESSDQSNDTVVKEEPLSLPTDDKNKDQVKISKDIETLNQPVHSQCMSLMEKETRIEGMKEDEEKKSAESKEVDKLPQDKSTPLKVEEPNETNRLDKSTYNKLMSMAEPTSDVVGAKEGQSTLAAKADALCEKTLEEGREVPDNKTIEGKLVQTSEKKEGLREPTSEVSSSFQGIGLSESSVLTSETGAKEKFALDSIISETLTDSMKVSKPKKQLMSESEQTELPEAEQFVEKQTSATEGNRIQPSPEQSHKEQDVPTISQDELSKRDVIEEKIKSLNLNENVGVTEDKGVKTVGEEYLNVSLPFFTSVIDTVDDSNDSDSSSDISRETTLTTRPYQTPRHRSRESPAKEISQTVETNQMYNAEPEEEASLMIDLMGDETVESPNDDKMFEKTEDASKQQSFGAKLIEIMKDAKLSKKEEMSASAQLPFSQVKVITVDNEESVSKEKQLMSKSSSGIEEPSNSVKHAKGTKSESKTKGPSRNDSSSVSKTSKAESLKTGDKKVKETERKRLPWKKKKKSLSEESSEERATHSQDQGNHIRHRVRKQTDDRSKQKNADQTKESRRLDEVQRRKQATSKLKSEKDKKSSSSSEKHSSPPKTGEIDTSKAQPKYMAWYKKNREEMEKKRAEMKSTDDEEQLPRWLRRSMKNQKSDKDGKKKAEDTPRPRRKVKPLVNVESEQLKAIVRQGRKLRKAEGGKNEDPPVQIFALVPPAPPPDTKHHLVQHSEYKYEKTPAPFYLHPPPAPHPSPQLSPERFDVQPTMERGHIEEDFDPGVGISLQSGNRLRHQQLLEKKSVFDIAYSEAAPSQLRSDSTTPPS